MLKISEKALSMARTRENDLIVGDQVAAGSIARDAGLTYPTFIHISLWGECIARRPGDGIDGESSRLKKVVECAARRLLEVKEEGIEEEGLPVGFDFSLPGSVDAPIVRAYVAVGPVVIPPKSDSDLKPAFSIFKE